MSLFVAYLKESLVAVEDRNVRSDAPPLKSRVVVATALLLPLVASALLLRVLSPSGPAMPDAVTPKAANPSLEGEESLLTPPPEIKFPTGGPTPPGTVTLADVRFTPVKRIFPSPFPFQVDVRFADGLLKLVDSRTEKAFWIGPTAKADFTETTTAAVHTITDGKGKVLWSNAAERAHPDLLLQRSDPGQARLISKKGTILWSGPLQRMTSSVSTKSGPENSYEVRAGGLIITGRKGTFTITDNDKKVLWSGQLPPHPSLMVRDGENYTFAGDTGAESGADRVITVNFESEEGHVVISTPSGKTLGKRPFAIFKYRHQIRSTMRTPGRWHAPQFQTQIRTHDARLRVNGTAFLTFQDSRGRVYRRAKLYKDKSSSGFETRG